MFQTMTSKRGSLSLSPVPPQVMSRWEEYMSKVRPKQGRVVEAEAVAVHFPFHKYFSNAPQPVFRGRTYEEDMDIAEGCYRHIKKIFTQLEVSRSHWAAHTLQRDPSPAVGLHRGHTGLQPSLSHKPKNTHRVSSFSVPQRPAVITHTHTHTH